MTVRQLFEGVLIDLNKINAPTLKLYEFNYLCNKAINQYINKIYNIYDINQQTTDDLRVLKSTATIVPQPVESKHTNSALTGKTGTYAFNMPTDYLHLLNCVCVYQMNQQKDCYDKGDYVYVPASRLTADSWGMIMEDVYNRPSPMRPYYYIHHRNSNTDLPTNPYTPETKTELEKGTDFNPTPDYDKMYVDLNRYAYKPDFFYDKDGNLVEGETTFTDLTDDYNEAEKQAAARHTYNKNNIQTPIVSNISRTFKLNDTTQSAVEKPEGVRHSNASPIRCEIRYGRDDSVFKLVEVQVDYIKSPQYIRLTQTQLDLTEDTSQMMEFPDYINQEIINELVHIVMERSGDPRLATNLQITQSIARPTQQQQPNNTNN